DLQGEVLEMLLRRLEGVFLIGEPFLLDGQLPRAFVDLGSEVLDVLPEAMQLFQDDSGTWHGIQPLACRLALAKTLAATVAARDAASAKRRANCGWSIYKKKSPVTRTGERVSCFLTLLVRVEEALKLPASHRMLQLADRLRLDLAYAF